MLAVVSKSRFGYLFCLILVVYVNSITPLSILLGKAKSESKPVIGRIKENDAADLEEAGNLVSNFLTNGVVHDDGEVEFHIHGWKWHTMSLIHEARRLSHIATILHARSEQDLQREKEKRETTDIVEALRTVVDYTIDFNMRGLHRIEDEVFFPIVRRRISSSSSLLSNLSKRDQEHVTTAITNVLDQLDKDRQRVGMMGTSLVRLRNFL
jgi:hypothetical protein